jgi:putative nucleotidyltransferase with HDIG domain
MYQLVVISDSRATTSALREKLLGVLDVQFATLQEALACPPGPATLFDIDLAKELALPQLKRWIGSKPANAKAMFLVNKGSHLQEARACALGATDVLPRPLDYRALLTKLWGDVASLSVDAGNAALRKSPAVCAAIDTLQNIFSAACLGEQLDAPAINSAGDAVVSHVETQGLNAWIETVRTHHSATYQHCLLVTGLAVAFGQQIRVSRADRQRLSFAGMLHDIGKARIPLAILEKPSRLTDGEMDVMKKHPQFGFDALKTAPGLPAEMLDMVVHHHEYLDGSGYPHGLTAREISDLVRMITIADVFGALIERRSYKAPLSGTAAYNILLDMGPKLDKDLVREFRPVADLGLRH